MKTIHVDDIETLPALGGELRWKPVRRALDVTAFGINAYSGDAGELIVEDHADDDEELYLVVRGHARFAVGGVDVDAPAGTFVVLEPGERRVAHAAEPGTLVLAVGGEHGSFAPSGWEFSFRAKALYDLGRLDEARAMVDEGLRRYPGRADILYGRACLEAAAGDDAAALATLSDAAAQEPVVLEWAAEETAFEALRSDPRWPVAR